MESAEKLDVLDRIIKDNEGPGSSIIILQKIQSLFGCVTPEMISYVTDRTGIPESDLYGIATFYSQFRLHPPGRHLIKACCGTACHLGGAEKVAKAIADETGVAEGTTGKDGMFSFETVSCLGCCSLAPVMVVDENVYGNLTPKAVKKVIKEIKSKHQGDN